MVIEKQLKHIFTVFALACATLCATVQAQSIINTPNNTNDRGSSERSVYRGSTDTRSSNRDSNERVIRYGDPGYSIRYEDKHFGVQIGTSNCRYNCGDRYPYYDYPPGYYYGPPPGYYYPGYPPSGGHYRPHHHKPKPTPSPRMMRPPNR